MSSTTPVKRYCPDCGTPTFDPTQRFCASCGSLLKTEAAGDTSRAAGGLGAGIDGAVNQYLQDRMRESSAVLAAQVKQELKVQARRTAETQLRRHGGKLVLYGGVGLAALIVLGAIMSVVTNLLATLLPLALVVLAVYVGYSYLSRRMRRR